jgi:hypothetical protein
MNPIAFTTRRALAPAWLGLLALSLGAGAQAQTYTSVSSLQPYASVKISAGESVPSGTPAGMDKTGQVIGRALTGGQLSFDFSTFQSKRAYSLWAVRWAAGTAAKPAATKITTTVIPTTANAIGNWAGYIPASSTLWGGTPFPRLFNDTPAVSINGTVTKIKYGVNGRIFEAIDMNSRNWVLGKAVGDANGLGDQIRGLVWKNGTVSELDSGGYRKVFPLKMNDNGDVVGTVMSVTYTASGLIDSYEEYAALWVNQQLAWVGPARSAAVSINNQGQFLVRDPNLPSGWELRYNNTVTPITVGTPYTSIQDLKINNNGVVAGLRSDYDPSTFRSSPQRPFLWRNGAVTDVLAQLDAQGVAWGAGQHDSMQSLMAFNDQGAMLLSYSNFYTYYMRLNAAP